MPRPNWIQRMWVKSASNPPITYFTGGGTYSWPKWNYRVYCEEGYQANPYVFRGINFVTNGLGSLNWQLHRRLKDGEVEEVNDHPLLDLIDRPNRYTGKSLFFQTVGSHLLIGGASHTLKIGPNSGPPTELHSLTPSAVTLQKGDAVDPIKAFKYKPDAMKSGEVYGPGDVIYMRVFNPLAPLEPFPPMAAMARAVDMSNEAHTWNMSLLKNSARPPGAFVVDGSLTDEEYERAKQDMRANLQGGPNAGNPLLLEGGATWVPFGYSPAEMGWDNLVKITAREVALVLNIPPECLGDESTKTYSNYRTAVRAAWTEGILPLADMVRDELNVWLVPDFEDDGDDLYLDYRRDDIEALREDRDSLWTRAIGAVNSGVLTPNEAREEIGRSPIDGGDELIVQANRVPLDALTGMGPVE